MWHRLVDAVGVGNGMIKGGPRSRIFVEAGAGEFDRGADFIPGENDRRRPLREQFLECRKIAPDVGLCRPGRKGSYRNHQVLGLGGEQLFHALKIQSRRQVCCRPAENEEAVLILLRLEIIANQQSRIPGLIDALYFILVNRCSVEFLLLQRFEGGPRCLAR